MKDLTVIVHFSNPRWPLVNKISGISKCLDVKFIHCPSVQDLNSCLAEIQGGRVLMLTDEGLTDLIETISQKTLKFEFEIALFVFSKITNLATKISHLACVRYLLEFDERDSYVGRHLAILIKKVKEQNYLDLDKYLGFGSRIISTTISSNLTKRKAIEDINKFIINLGDPKYTTPYVEYARRITEMVDELVLNAIFNANPRMTNADRSAPFSLDHTEEVHLSWGYDGEYFGVSVRDFFGQFSLETILERISSNPNATHISNLKSAGLGQKLIFERAHQIVTNIKKRKVTEVIAVVKFENRLLDFERAKKSFFYFTDGI